MNEKENVIDLNESAVLTADEIEELRQEGWNCLLIRYDEEYPAVFQNGRIVTIAACHL